MRDGDEGGVGGGGGGGGVKCLVVAVVCCFRMYVFELAKSCGTFRPDITVLVDWA